MHLDDNSITYRPQSTGLRSTKFLLVVQKTSLRLMMKQKTRYIYTMHFKKTSFLNKDFMISVKQ